MDYIYIPCRLSELTIAQVCLINRWRERWHGRDPQFRYNRVVRYAVADYLSKNGFCAVIELGPGRYPIVELIADEKKVHYHAVDIDEDAVEWLQMQGWTASREILPRLETQFDCGVALFVLHFNVSLDTLAGMYAALCQDGVWVASLFAPQRELEVVTTALEGVGFSVATWRALAWPRPGSIVIGRARNRAQHGDHIAPIGLRSYSVGSPGPSKQAFLLASKAENGKLVQSFSAALAERWLIDRDQVRVDGDDPIAL